MTLRMSGLWCDVGNHPILSGEYWDASVNGKRNCHVCQKCKDKMEGT